MEDVYERTQKLVSNQGAETGKRRDGDREREREDKKSNKREKDGKNLTKQQRLSFSRLQSCPSKTAVGCWLENPKLGASDSSWMAKLKLKLGLNYYNMGVLKGTGRPQERAAWRFAIGLPRQEGTWGAFSALMLSWGSKL